MGVYPRSAVERMMKVPEVIMRAIEGRIQWRQAAAPRELSGWRHQPKERKILDTTVCRLSPYRVHCA